LFFTNFPEADNRESSPTCDGVVPGVRAAAASALLSSAQLA